MPLRTRPAVALLLALGLGACRPAVETEVPCGEDIPDDLACPTGYHCGQEHFCEQGEAPPRVRFVHPQEGDTLSGSAALGFHASSPLGLGRWALTLEKGGSKVADLSLQAAWDTDAENLSGLFTATLDTASLDDGDYQLVASIENAQKAAGVENTAQVAVHVKVAHRPN